MILGCGLLAHLIPKRVVDFGFRFGTLCPIAGSRNYKLAVAFLFTASLSKSKQLDYSCITFTILRF